MKFIFIGGCGRSGTTLVQKVLTSHSKIGGGPEFDFSGEIGALYNKMSSQDKVARLSFFYDETSIRKIFQDFYLSFFQKLIKENPDITIISEKTPININHAEVLLKLFPDAVFVNVIRDGRDVYVSHKEVAQRYAEKKQKVNADSFSVYGVSKTWNSALYKYEKLKESPVADRVINVFYEKLLVNPEVEIRNICQAVGIEFEKGMVNPEFVNKEFDKKFTADGVWYTNEKLNQDFNTSKINRWKKELSEEEKIQLSQLMNENLKRFGYETETYSSSKILKTKLLRKIKRKS